MLVLLLDDLHILLTLLLTDRLLLLSQLEFFCDAFLETEHFLDGFVPLFLLHFLSFHQFKVLGFELVFLGRVGSHLGVEIVDGGYVVVSLTYQCLVLLLEAGIRLLDIINVFLEGLNMTVGLFS